MGLTLTVHLQPLDPSLAVPTKSRPGDAAIDLPARSAGSIEPGARALVPTGFAIAVPEGACALVLARSGLALNHGVTVLNGPGLIDSGYRGELKIILVNHGDRRFDYERGQRIAQLLVLMVADLCLINSAELPPAPDDRGPQGFGSSG